MLYELEWNTPHTSPGGKSVKDWVAEIKMWEEKKWLVDPAEMGMTEPEHIRREEFVGAVCRMMCWRERCHRAGRCKTRLKLAIREFQPEYGIVMYRRGNRPLMFNGEPDPEKMAIMEERFDKLEEMIPNLFTRWRGIAAKGKKK